MNFHHPKLKNIGWNERFLDEEIFDLCTAEEGILVYDVALPLDGLYGVIENVPVILLNKDIRGIKRLEVAWHEMGHHFFDSPEFCAFSKDVARVAQYRAQVIAVCALIPKNDLEKMIKWQTSDLNFYSMDLLNFRLQVFQNHRI